MSHQPLAVAVVGVGRMGRHHARTYSGLPGVRLVAVVDSNAERAGLVADEFRCAAFRSVQDLLERHADVQAVTIAVPTAAHLSAAEPFLTRGIACLVEKPLACSAPQAQALVDLAQRHNAVLQVGHTERFNPVVQTVLGMNMTARFMEVHRVSPMTFRSLDVGVVMDMMIHDLDIVLLLARSPLAKVDAAGVAVIGEHEDIANARLTFASGCVANVTASRLALKTERKMRLFSDDAYVSLDYARRRGVIIRKSENSDALRQARAALAAGEDLSQIDYTKLVHVDELPMGEPNVDALTRELNSFVLAARRQVPPAVTGQEGLRAVQAAESVLASLWTHRWQGIADPVVP